MNDQFNILSDQVQVLTTAVSDTYDLGPDITGGGSLYGLSGKDNIWLQTVVQGEDYAGGTSVQVTYETDDDVAFGSAVTLLTGETVLVASALVGVYLAVLFLPSVSTKLQRYIRASYTIAGSPSAGKLSTLINQAGPATNIN